MHFQYKAAGEAELAKVKSAGNSGEIVSLWDQERSEPILSFSWGSGTTTGVRFNPVERNVLASVGHDRGLVLYDTRLATPIKKVVMRMRSSCVSWNPMEAFNFTCANEDHNCYSFDMRKLNVATLVRRDHVMPVLDVDYSPTGEELARLSTALFYLF